MVADFIHAADAGRGRSMGRSCLGPGHLYGVIAYAVSQLTREIASEWRLGSTTPGAYGKCSSRHGLLLTVIGRGLMDWLRLSPACLPFDSALRGFAALSPSSCLTLQRVSPWNWSITALLASYFPHGAHTVDPVEALRGNSN